MPRIYEEPDHPGGDITVNAPSSTLSAPAQGVIDFTKGQAIGVAKGAAGMIPESVAPTGWKEWSRSPGQGGAESAGEWVGDIGANVAPAFAVGPALRGFSALTQIPRFSEAMGNLALRALGPASKAYPWAVRGAKAIERTGEGMLGGGLEAGIQNEDEQDPWKFARAVATGTVEGGISSGAFNVGRAAYEALPPAVQSKIASGALGLTVAGGGVLLWDTMGGHHYIPWHALYLSAMPLLGLAKGVSRLPPAVVGAGWQGIAHGGARSPSPEDEGERIAPEQ